MFRRLDDNQKKLAEEYTDWAKGCSVFFAKQLLNKFKTPIDIDDLVGAGLIGFLEGIALLRNGGMHKGYLKKKIQCKILDKVRKDLQLRGWHRVERKLREYSNVNPVATIPPFNTEELETKDLFDYALKPLSNRNQMIWEMYYKEGYNSTEIGEIFNLDKSTVLWVLKYYQPLVKKQLTSLGTH